MPVFAMVLAIGAATAAALPWPGMFLAMGLGLGAIGFGVVGYRRREAPGGRRVLAAGAIAVGGVGLALAVLRFALTVAAIDKLETFLRG